MATTMVSTARGTGTTNIQSALRIVDMADKIYLLQPEAAPLYVLVSKLNKRVAINTTVYWPEDDLNPTWSTLAASCTSAATGLTVATGTGTYFNAYDLVKIVETGEQILVTATAADGITAVRGYGTTTAASAANASNLLILGPAFEEGAPGTALGIRSTQATTAVNYLQLFRKGVAITKTLANSELYGGNDRNYQRMKKGVELMRDFEHMFFFGEKSEDTSSSGITYARRTTGGINSYISTNSTAINGILTEPDFESFIRVVMRYGDNEKYLFCAPLIISVVSQWAQGKLTMFPKDKTYGIAISQYLSPHGSINLVKDVLLEHAGSPSSTSYYAGYAFAVELEEIVYRFLQNRDVQLEMDIQNPSDDYYLDQYICEVGMEFHNEKKHSKLTGVTG